MKELRYLAIKTIKVEKLFGFHDYVLTLPKDTEEANKILILYGNNGSGKTTILKLAFHLLAPDDKMGHKTAVAPILFKRVDIELTDGSVVSAMRNGKKLNGTFSMQLKRPTGKEVEAEFVANDEFSVILKSTSRNASDVVNFLKKLYELKLGLYFLSDDRQIQLAGISDDRSRGINIDEDITPWASDDIWPTRISRDNELTPETIAKRLLTKSIMQAESWIRARVIKGSSEGESSVNSLYNEILHRLVALPQEQRVDKTSTKKMIETRVSNLETECMRFFKYGLMPKFDGSEILKAVETSHDQHLGIIANVLNPYLESVEKKLEALAKVHHQTDTLVTVLNRFLTDKTLSFDLHFGLTVTAIDGTVLTPQMLSSGERHLFLLFCNSLVAVERPSLIMIDEPEISLNIKWQRTLISSLLECIGDSPVQYIFATHSMELLAQHRNRVIKLEDRIKG